MSYITDFESEFTKRLVSSEKSETLVRWVCEKLLESYRNGITAGQKGTTVKRQTITYSTNAALENTITANLHLEVMAWPVGFTGQSRSWSFSANGIGFNNFDARQQAEDRIIHRIASDSTWSLSNLSANK